MKEDSLKEEIKSLHASIASMHDKVNHVVKQTMLETSRKVESKLLSKLFDSSNDRHSFLCIPGAG
jgi:hypothetical protein